MLVKWNPFANGGIARSAAPVPELDELFREADRLFEGAFATPSTWTSRTGVPPADIHETQDELVLTIDLPGYDPKSLDLQVEGDVLTVRATRDAQRMGNARWFRQERSYGQVARSFVLPSSVDATKCEARCEHGVLTVTLPKREEAKPRSIAVTVKS
ncbi:MAG: Hsp20/alpha crystallin family protein [Archangiaceae bacterium]|nr:Hsp20/alpha crystallin family protein [Archangiaceae bacterium]